MKILLSLGVALGRACLQADWRQVAVRYERWQQGERTRKAIMRSRPSR